MRTMWTAAVLLLLAGIATDAPAGDDKAPAPKKVVEGKVLTEEEWFAKVKDIQNIDVVGVKRTDVLSREANKCVIRVRVKIWDIVASKNGPSIEIMDVSPSATTASAGRLSREPIVLPAEDSAAIAEWKRWDRLAFKVKPKVLPDGALQYTRAITGAVDIDRVPNPGIEHPPCERPLARADSFRDWLDRYVRACESADWKIVWKSYSSASSMYFPMTATVRGAEDTRVQRGTATRVFDISPSTGVTGYGFLDAQGHPRTSVACTIDDPQINEALRAGARAEIYFRVRGFERREDIEVRSGRFQVDAMFGRLK